MKRSHKEARRFKDLRAYVDKLGSKAFRSPWAAKLINAALTKLEQKGLMAEMQQALRSAN